MTSSREVRQSHLLYSRIATVRFKSGASAPVRDRYESCVHPSAPLNQKIVYSVMHRTCDLSNDSSSLMRCRCNEQRE